MENVFSLCKSGYCVTYIMTVEMAQETDKAFKFVVLDSNKKYTFFLPKKAVRFDKSSNSILHLAHWFTVEGFHQYLWDTYANAYKR